MFKPGQTFGNYTLVHPLGRGGFGEVWLADRTSKLVTTQVAIKLPFREDIDPELIRREVSVWQLASGHPNVLPLIDADEIDGQVLLVTEYMPDGSLEDLLNIRGHLTPDEASALMLGILDGLEYLHSRKIIHRDIKPGNILLQGGTPRLTDFGISRTIRNTTGTSTANISGTFAYMPPEAFDGKRTVQSDIWSCGVLLYKLLTGRLPFDESETTRIIGAILTKEPAPLPSWVPEETRLTVAGAMQKSASRRFKSAADMRAHLAGGRSRKPRSTPDPPSEVTKVRPKADAKMPQSTDQEEVDRILRKLFRLAVIVALTLVAIVVWGYIGMFWYTLSDIESNYPAANLGTRANNIANSGQGLGTGSNRPVEPLRNIPVNSAPQPMPTPNLKQLEELTKAAVDRTITDLSRLDGDRYVLTDDPLTKLGDLNGDGLTDAIVVFCSTLYGSNGYDCHLAGFRNDGPSFSSWGVIDIGGKGGEVPGEFSIRQGLIQANTTVWKDDDPMCCPTGKGKMALKVQNDRLIRVR